MSKEYIEREAVIKHKRMMQGFGFSQQDEYLAAAVLVEDIEKIPAADVEEVIRCKNCKYYAAMITDMVGDSMETAPWGICTQPWFNSDEYDAQEDGYCSYGERKIDGEKQS